jgi:hypothetical protein
MTDKGSSKGSKDGKGSKGSKGLRGSNGSKESNVCAANATSATSASARVSAATASASARPILVQSVSAKHRFGRLVDNFALRVLSGKFYPEELTREDLVKAKRNVDSFTTVLDMGW